MACRPTRCVLTASTTLAIVAAFGGVREAAAQSMRSGETDLGFELPTDSRLWHNSPPLTLESLSGKGVVFYFFEEEDRRIAANWPNLVGLAQQYEGKPVLFIAVNSGTDPRLLKRYLSQAGVRWPVIHDYDRSLEDAMGVPKLTPEGEVFAVKYVSGDGSVGTAKADFASAAEAALKGAAWRVDPAEVPPKLLGAWKSVELGDFAGAARAVVQATESKDDDLKAAGEKLLAAVEEELTDTARLASDAIREGDDWTAFKLLESIEQRFDGYEFELIERAETRAKELARSDAVKDQRAAEKLLEKAMATGAKGTPSAVNRAKGLLQRIVEDHPSADAAQKAQEVLATLQ